MQWISHFLVYFVYRHVAYTKQPPTLQKTSFSLQAMIIGLHATLFPIFPLFFTKNLFTCLLTYSMLLLLLCNIHTHLFYLFHCSHQWRKKCVLVYLLKTRSSLKISKDFQFKRSIKSKVNIHMIFSSFYLLAKKNSDKEQLNPYF